MIPDKINLDQFIDSLMIILNVRDINTYNHSLRVSEIAVKIAENISLDKKVIEQIHLAAHLHDIGKIGLSDKILNKPGRLTRNELLEIQKHPEIAYNILNKLSLFKEIALIVLYHHERYDGLGYPQGLRGEEIPLESRIIAVADAFDAMTSDRSYRRALSYDEASLEINKHIFNQFCPLVVECFNEIKDAVYDRLTEISKNEVVSNRLDNIILVKHDYLGHSQKVI